MGKGKAPSGGVPERERAKATTTGPGAGAPGPCGVRALVHAAVAPDIVAPLPVQATGDAALAAARSAVASGDGGWVWLDVAGHDAQMLHTLESALRLTRGALHETLRSESRSQFKEYPRHVFMLLQVPVAGHGAARAAAADSTPATAGEHADRTRFPTQRLGVFVTHALVVTVHAEPLPVVDAAWAEFAHLQGQYETLQPDRVLHALAEDVLALFLPAVDRVEERIDSLERAVFSGRNREPLNRVLGLKRDLLAMRRTVAPLRDAISGASRRDTPVLHVSTRVLLGDLYDRSLRIMDILENLRDLLASLVDAHLTVQSHRLSEIMRTLTVIATLMMPLTVITGYFGMNFARLPGLDSAAAVWVVTGAMGLVVVAMIAYFRIRGWY